MKTTTWCKATLLASLAASALSVGAQTQAPPPSGTQADALINKLVQKGILSEKEGKDILSETATNNFNNSLASASKWKLSNAIKGIELYGVMRFRYEYRSADNAVPGIAGSSHDDYYR